MLEVTRTLDKETRTKIILVEPPSGDIKEGGKVRVMNHYSGKYGVLFGKTGVVQTIGKTSIFFDVEGIPVTQQKTEANLELVKTKV